MVNLYHTHSVEVGEEVGMIAPEEVGPGNVIRVFHSPVNEAVLLMATWAYVRSNERVTETGQTIFRAIAMHFSRHHSVRRNNEERPQRRV